MGRLTVAYRDIEKRRAADRSRAARRSAERRAAGLCPRCGKHPPAPERAICEPCGERQRERGRKRDARLREAGKPRRDRRKARAYNRKRDKREREERKAAGVCVQCGKVPAAPDSLRCEPCADKRREGEREQYAEAKAAGKPYGGKNAIQKRAEARDRAARKRAVRLAAGLCPRCGKHAPAPGRSECEPCLEKRRASESHDRAVRAARGQCAKCQRAALPGKTRCAEHAESGVDPDTKNARSRERYWSRRWAALCTSCGAPSGGPSRCPSCAERSLSGMIHRQARDGFEPGAGYAGQDGGEAYSLAEAREGCAD